MSLMMLRRVLVMLVALVLTQAALGQDYPTRPIHVIIPFPPGGGTDLIARVVTQKLSEAWGQPIVVENRDGGGSIIGTEMAAKAAPDGYTLIVVNSAHAINPAFRSLPYDSINDFIPVSLITTQASLFVVTPSLPVHNVREFIALAKSKPYGLNYASGGLGSSAQLAAELFASMTGVKVTHVPYKGTAEYMPDLLSGRVDFIFAPMANVLQPVQSGKLRAIAVTSAKRSATIPDLPTVMEEGVPNYQAISWNMMLVPAKTSRAIVNKLNTETVRTLKRPEVQNELTRQGAEPAGDAPEDALRFLRSETELWGKVIKAANIKAE